MNEVIKAMEERRSIRSFQPEMPAKTDLKQIVEAGLYAPNAMGRQATMILAVTNKEVRDKLSEENRQIAGAPKGFDPFYGAPAVMLVLADKNVATHVYDGSLVVGNMLLAAHSLGLGAIWIHRAKEESERPVLQEILKAHGIDGDWEGIGHCAVGYVAGDYPEAAERKADRVCWVE